jgi:hypothetical protein
MPEGGALLRMFAWICKRSLRNDSVSRVRLGMLTVFFAVFVETLGILEFMPFAGTKTECNQNGE